MTTIEPTELAPPSSDQAERFALARRDPGFAFAMMTRVASPGLELRQIAPIVALILLGYLVVGPFSHDRDSLLLVLAAAAAVCLVGWRLWRPFLAPIEKRLAYVRSRTTQVRHISLDEKSFGRTVLEQRLTLELEDGQRVTLGGAAAILESVSEGEVGVAFTRADRLMGFRRLGE